MLYLLAKETNSLRSVFVWCTARFRVDRVAELRTGDGFLLDGNDIIGEVLRDQQVVSCLHTKQQTMVSRV
jgi:hypothetical protein